MQKGGVHARRRGSGEALLLRREEMFSGESLHCESGPGAWFVLLCAPVLAVRTVVRSRAQCRAGRLCGSVHGAHPGRDSASEQARHRVRRCARSFDGADIEPSGYVVCEPSAAPQS